MRTKRFFRWLSPLVLLLSLIWGVNVWAASGYSGYVSVAQDKDFYTTVSSGKAITKSVNPGDELMFYIAPENTDCNAEYDIQFDVIKATQAAQYTNEASVELSRVFNVNPNKKGLVGYKTISGVSRPVYEYIIKVKDTVTEGQLGIRIKGKVNSAGKVQTLATIFVNINKVVNSITIGPDRMTVETGDTCTFTASVVGAGENYDCVDWCLSGGSDRATDIIEGQYGSRSCTVQIGDETASSLTLIASTYSYKDGNETEVKATPVTIYVKKVKKVSGVEIDGDHFLVMEPGKSNSFTAEVLAVGGASDQVVWSVSGGKTSSATQITTGGKLTIGQDEKGETITVTATAKDDATKSDTVKIHVGHHWEKVSDKTASTCKTPGIGNFVCSICQAEDTQVLALSNVHQFGQAVVTKEATKEAAGEKTSTCSVCGAKKTTAYELSIGTIAVGKNTVKLFADGTAMFTAAGTSQTAVKIPASVKANGKSYKVTAIGENAFRNCKKVTTIKIGKNVSEIGAYAFKDCRKLKTLEIGTTKLSSKTVNKAAFTGTRKSAEIKVPAKKLKAYKKLLKKSGLKSVAKVKAK